MRRIPARIATPDSAEDVTREVRRLLRAAGVKDQLPTPRAEVLACQKLVETGELDLEEYEATLAEKGWRFFQRAKSKVMGILDRRSEIIYIAPHVHESRKLFVTYHEVAHSILQWQKIELTQEDESTLSPECKELFEAEANYGAADILFQCDRFENESRDYALSLESALYLSGRYEASCHSTLRRFAERNHRPCLLMILAPTGREYHDGLKSYYVVYSVPSGQFSHEFGDELNSKFVNPVDDLGKILNSGGHGEIVLTDVKGFARTCVVQVFDNQYKTFALIYPSQAHRSRRVVHMKNIESRSQLGT